MAAEDFEKELNGEKPKKSKDFWLFLIFIDIIALVFFGFLIYQSLSAKFTAPAPGKGGVPVKESVAKNAPKTEAQAQEITSAPEIASASAPLPVQQNLPPAPPPAAQPAQQPAPQPQPAAAQPQKKVEPKRQSVFIESTNGKGRKVTFKYFGAAKSASIVSGFTMTKPQALKKIDGVWQGSFVIYPGEYKYLFIIDGVKTLDPNAAESDGRSVVTIP